MFSNKLKKLLQENESQGSLLKDLSVSKNQGKVLSVIDGVVTISGLYNIYIGKILKFFSGIKGMVLSLEENSVRAVLFGNEEEVLEGDSVNSIKYIMSIFIGILCIIVYKIFLLLYEYIVKLKNIVFHYVFFFFNKISYLKIFYYFIILFFLIYFFNFYLVEIDFAWGQKVYNITSNTANKYFNSCMKPFLSKTSTITHKTFSNIAVRSFSSTGSTLDLVGSDAAVLLQQGLESPGTILSMDVDLNNIDRENRLYPSLVSRPGIVMAKPMYSAHCNDSFYNDLTEVPFISSYKVSQISKLLNSILMDKNIDPFDKHYIEAELFKFKKCMLDFHTNFTSLVVNNIEDLSPTFCTNWISKTSIGEKNVIYLLQSIKGYNPFGGFTNDMESIHSPLKNQLIPDWINSKNLLYFYLSEKDYLKVINETSHAHFLANGEFYKFIDSSTGKTINSFRPRGWSLNEPSPVKITDVVYCDPFIPKDKNNLKTDVIVQDKFFNITPIQLSLFSNPENYSLALKIVEKHMKDFVSHSDNQCITMVKDLAILASNNCKLLSSTLPSSKGIVLLGHLNFNLEPFTCLLNGESLNVYPLDIQKIPVISTNSLEKQLVELQYDYLLDHDKKFLALENFAKNYSK